MPGIGPVVAAELVADKGCDSNALRDWLEERGTTAVIPPRKSRKVQYDYDRTVYKQHNIIERMFCASRTGAASRPATTAISETSSPPLLSPPPSSGGYNETGP